MHFPHYSISLRRCTAYFKILSGWPHRPPLRSSKKARAISVSLDGHRLRKAALRRDRVSRPRRPSARGMKKGAAAKPSASTAAPKIHLKRENPPPQSTLKNRFSVQMQAIPPAAQGAPEPERSPAERALNARPFGIPPPSAPLTLRPPCAPSRRAFRSPRAGGRRRIPRGGRRAGRAM